MKTPLVVIVPVYNEGENIRAWWAMARTHLPADAIVRVVYDFDEDNTIPMVKELNAAGAPLHLLKNRSRGVLQAMLTGLASVDSGPVLISMADGSDDFSTLPAMLTAYNAGATVVVASRFMPGGQMLGGPWLKRQLARWGGVSLRAVAGFPVHDATNNFRLYDASFVRSLTIESTGGFELAFEITVAAWRAGQTVVEIPTTWRDRTAGESRFNLRKWLPLYARLWATALVHGLVVRKVPGWLACVCALALVLVLLVLRAPYSFAVHQLWAEDALVFMRGGLHDPWGSVLVPYAGYFHLFPRLWAALTRMVPVAAIPTLYLFGALVATAIAVATIFHARLRLGSVAKILFSVLLVTPVMSDEVLLTITNVQWLFAPALLLLVLGAPPKSRAQAGVDIALFLLLGLTGPFVLLFLPLLCVRYVIERSTHAAVMMTATAFLGIVHASQLPGRLASNVLIPHVQPALALASGQHIGAPFEFIRTISLRVEQAFFGINTKYFDESLELWLSGSVFFFIITSLVVIRAMRRRDIFVLLMLGGCLISLAAPLFLFRYSPGEISEWGAGDRYFHVPLVLWSWVLVASFQFHRWLSGIPLMMMVLSFSLYMPSAPLLDLDWAHASECLDQPGPCYIPVNPYGWLYERTK